MPKHSHEQTGFVFLNGAGLDSRIWGSMLEGLEFPYLLVESPRRKESLESRKELALTDYVTHAKRQIDAWEIRRFVIVAHSLGGVIALRLASERAKRLAGFVAVGAAIPGNGGSFLSVLPFPKRILLRAIMRTMGTRPPESAIRAGLCSDLTGEQAAEIVQGFTPEAIRLYTDKTGTSVPQVPKLYVKLTRDKEFDPSLQNKMISNLSPEFVRELDTGHLPMLSDPDGLRGILEDFMTARI